MSCSRTRKGLRSSSRPGRSATRSGSWPRPRSRTKADNTPTQSPRLKLVLVEKKVAYRGGNQQSNHHHVVRAFPAGVEGTPLEGGKGRVETTVSLDKLRADQAAYLKAYPDSPKSRGKFPRALPPIALDHLSVVAIVQDNHDHSIWHAVVVPGSRKRKRTRSMKAASAKR